MKNNLLVNGQNIQKSSSQTKAIVLLFSANFANEFVMYCMSVNKQLMCLQNCFCFIAALPMKGLQYVFLFTVSLQAACCL
jgi:hypothetical protein